MISPKKTWTIILYLLTIVVMAVGAEMVSTTFQPARHLNQDGVKIQRSTPYLATASGLRRKKASKAVASCRLPELASAVSVFGREYLIKAPVCQIAPIPQIFSKLLVTHS